MVGEGRRELKEEEYVYEYVDEYGAEYGGPYENHRLQPVGAVGQGRATSCEKLFTLN